MSITDVCIKKPVFAWMIMAATIIFGLVAAQRIGISQFPDVDFPTINISVSWEGANPEAVESDVVEFIEEAVTQVEGVKSITSSARQGSANITVELDLSRNVDLALQDVQTKVSQAQRRLPLDIDPPVVSKSNPEDQPIMWLGVAGPFSQQVVSDFARYRVKERLQTVPGVGEVILGGLLERNVRIWVDAQKLDAHGLTVTDLIAALQREHVELPAGRIETQGREVNVRFMGEALDLETLANVAVREENGRTVYLHDVAIVEDGFEDERRLARVNGEPAQAMGIKKQRGANAVAVAQAVREQLAQLQKELPEGMSASINFDSTQFIEESVHEIEFELLLACILTAFVCWVFLGSLSSTLNVVLAIPMSLLGTVAVIYFLGFTLNTFTLLGLALAVGIVVDDAIMVLENIFRHAEEGKDRVSAAREGTAEITFAALAATLAVVAIFLPVVFMKGIIGRFFLQFGVTLCVAVLLSYVEAITLAPARCAQLLKTSREHRSRIGVVVDKAFSKLEALYARALGWGLVRPWRVLLAAVAMLILSAFAFKALPGEFVPSQDQGRMSVRLQTAVGSSLQETNRLFKRAEAFVASRPEVTRVFVVVGGGGSGSAVNSGNMNLTLVPTDQRMPQAEFAQVLRKELNSYPGLRAVVQDLSQAGFTAQRGFPVEFSVRGSDWDKLVEASQSLREELLASGKVVDLDTDYQLGQPELRITPDRARAADLGVPIQAVASTVNALVGGVRVGKYSSGGRRIDVRMRLLASQRSRPEDLSLLKVRTANNMLVPLSSLVTQEELPALQAITRRDRERAISLFANVAPGSNQEEALATVESLGKDLPGGIRVVAGGASVAFRDSMSSLIFALFLGIAVAYMVLGAQFNSFLHPVTVLTILPLSVAGASFALLVTGHTLNIFSMIGLLLLMGIVKKNSIILVDYALQQREQGADAMQAMLRAGPVRLRPILMTSMATMMAAVPAALALGAGSETRAPMSVAVLGGLSVSTVLSLLVVPAFYVVADRIKTRLGNRLSKGKGGDDSHSVPEEPRPVPHG
ncbi:efflux RND transporter permease subunit [Corallococcus sp. AB049A]|uniref:Efflux RND transporter permease subunit n=1 Tax=Corallococcus interemptor TaxID=2316720 RepID=A0A3A8QQH1_9BACT|nr:MULTISPECIES: efflux RND transporter permease subunit [Corallococcus]RKH51887.1 efflux RND transporter permease subunit [Corallococcus sp. AB050B]RKH71019.1 efflux RND transporter permease subunit [Corallococcus interemptor]RKI71584.1 efflux RND transporter permease subunit [Corallococcus sp. AB049A]